ncbi:Mitochondrial fission 1 protein [Pseudolycoriella hygida]|uniref:Mitochondrial fission 1 protein n=1 Tax=Pseudolycoriella hygida TaxID=35572 RepID=A0A9Q0MHY2_9DIPT|nr:Mitochondrial fission 1 protein [Pseudolycoriella hygida]
MDMEEILNETCSANQLQKFEKQYNKELNDGYVYSKTQFEYGTGLVLSRYPADIKKGLVLLEDLMAKHPEGNRDYLYYLVIGNARIKNYLLATKFLNVFKEIEPANSQIKALEKVIRKKMDRDAMIGLAYTSGAALVLAGIIGGAMALVKK